MKKVAIFNDEMTKKDFDSIKVGDIITNQSELNGRTIGYEYEVIERTLSTMKVRIIHHILSGVYTLYRDEVEKSPNLRIK